MWGSSVQREVGSIYIYYMLFKFKNGINYPIYTVYSKFIVRHASVYIYLHNMILAEINQTSLVQDSKEHLLTQDAMQQTLVP